MKNKWWYFLALGLLVLDMLTKFLTEGANITNTNIFIDIISVHNVGASWEVLAGQRVLFIVLGIIFIVGMVCYDIFSKNNNENGWFFAGYNLILAGILGNMIDRIVFSYVRDFISLAFMQFPVFNIADICLTVGTICIVVWLIFFFGKNKAQKDKINGN